MAKLDLHTHSILSHDGGINMQDYKRILNEKTLDFIAITDHNETAFAIQAQKEIGNQIIIGEEIMTLDGEIIGLYLKETIKPNQSAKETIMEIKKQGGLVYIPHPFDTRRKALGEINLNKILDSIDIIECFNARSFSTRINNLANVYAIQNNIVRGVGSDAHSALEIGKTYSDIEELPTVDNLKKLLCNATYSKKKVSLLGIIQPKLNKHKKLWKKS